MYKILKNYTLEDALKVESQDRQFLAYKKLYKNKKFSDMAYLFLILQNALISYQLSGKGEDYHEEFVNWVLENNNFENIDFYSLFSKFLIECKNNKRFTKIKLKRIKKSLAFYKDFSKNINFYYKNMYKLAEDLGKIMTQPKDAKTIVFAIKLFSYGARNIFSYVEKFPFNLMIPIDSRLENIYKLFSGKENYKKPEIKQFYIDLSKKLNIPMLHLDSILWVNYDLILKKILDAKG